MDNSDSSTKLRLNCSQKVLGHYAEQYGLSKDLAIKLATGLGGGMGRMAGTCGAVSGAYLVLGLEYGPSDNQSFDAKDITYTKVREFHQYFSEKHGSCTCHKLLGCDISTPEGYAVAKKNNIMGQKCPIFIEEAINIVEKVLNNDKIAASSNRHSDNTINNGK